MSDKHYIERYWRDATPADAISEPAMVARFRDEHYKDWVIDKLFYWDRSETPWHRDDGHCYEQCQVYDAPDPGEGWRLIDVTNEEYQAGDEIYDPSKKTWDKRLGPFNRNVMSFNRRRIEQPKPEAKYVPFTWADREQLRGRWIAWKHENGTMVEVNVNHITEQRNGDIFFKSRDGNWLLKNATFIDTGEPVGRKVDG